MNGRHIDQLYRSGHLNFEHVQGRFRNQRRTDVIEHVWQAYQRDPQLRNIDVAGRTYAISPQRHLESRDIRTAENPIEHFLQHSAVTYHEKPIPTELRSSEMTERAVRKEHTFWPLGLAKRFGAITPLDFPELIANSNIADKKIDPDTGAGFVVYQINSQDHHYSEYNGLAFTIKMNEDGELYTAFPSPDHHSAEYQSKTIQDIKYATFDAKDLFDQAGRPFVPTYLKSEYEHLKTFEAYARESTRPSTGEKPPSDDIPPPPIDPTNGPDRPDQGPPTGPQHPQLPQSPSAGTSHELDTDQQIATTTHAIGQKPIDSGAGVGIDWNTTDTPDVRLDILDMDTPLPDTERQEAVLEAKLSRFQHARAEQTADHQTADRQALLTTEAMRVPQAPTSPASAPQTLPATSSTGDALTLPATSTPTLHSQVSTLGLDPALLAQLPPTIQNYLLSLDHLTHSFFQILVSTGLSRSYNQAHMNLVDLPDSPLKEHWENTGSKGVEVSNGLVTNLPVNEKKLLLATHALGDSIPPEQKLQLLKELTFLIYLFNAVPYLSIEITPAGRVAVCHPALEGTLTKQILVLADLALKHFWSHFRMDPSRFTAWTQEWVDQLQRSAPELEKQYGFRQLKLNAVQKKIEETAVKLFAHLLQVGVGQTARVIGSVEKIKLSGPFILLDKHGIFVEQEHHFAATIEEFLRSTTPDRDIPQAEIDLYKDLMTKQLEHIRSFLKKEYPKVMDQLEYIAFLTMLLRTLKAHNRIPVLDWKTTSASYKSLVRTPGFPSFQKEGKRPVFITNGGCGLYPVHNKTAQVSTRVLPALRSRYQLLLEDLSSGDPLTIGTGKNRLNVLAVDIADYQANDPQLWAQLAIFGQLVQANCISPWLDRLLTTPEAQLLTAIRAQPSIVTVIDSFGRTALHIAAFYGDVRTVQLLLAHGALAHAKTVHGETPLSMAAARGHSGVMQLLLDHETSHADYQDIADPVRRLTRSLEEELDKLETCTQPDILTLCETTARKLRDILAEIRLKTSVLDPSIQRLWTEQLTLYLAKTEETIDILSHQKYAWEEGLNLAKILSFTQQFGIERWLNSYNRLTRFLVKESPFAPVLFSLLMKRSATELLRKKGLSESDASAAADYIQKQIIAGLLKKVGQPHFDRVVIAMHLLNLIPTLFVGGQGILLLMGAERLADQARQTVCPPVWEAGLVCLYNIFALYARASDLFQQGIQRLPIPAAGIFGSVLFHVVRGIMNVRLKFKNRYGHPIDNSGLTATNQNLETLMRDYFPPHYIANYRRSIRQIINGQLPIRALYDFLNRLDAQLQPGIRALPASDGTERLAPLHHDERVLALLRAFENDQTDSMDILLTRFGPGLLPKSPNLLTLAIDHQNPAAATVLLAHGHPIKSEHWNKAVHSGNLPLIHLLLRYGIPANMPVSETPDGKDGKLIEPLRLALRRDDSDLAALLTAYGSRDQAPRTLTIVTEGHTGAISLQTLAASEEPALPIAVKDMLIRTERLHQQIITPDNWRLHWIQAIRANQPETALQLIYNRHMPPLTESEITDLWMCIRADRSHTQQWLTVWKLLIADSDHQPNSWQSPLLKHLLQTPPQTEQDQKLARDLYCHALQHLNNTSMPDALRLAIYDYGLRYDIPSMQPVTDRWNMVRQAAVEGHIETLETLRRQSINLFRADPNGQTLWHLAAISPNSRLWEYLIDISHGQIPCQPDHLGQTPLYLLSCQTDTLNRLRNGVIRSGISKADLCRADGTSMIHHLVRFQALDIIQELHQTQDIRPYLTLPDPQGNTPQRLAEQLQWEDGAAVLRDIQAVTLEPVIGRFINRLYQQGYPVRPERFTDQSGIAGVFKDALRDRHRAAVLEMIPYFHAQLFTPTPVKTGFLSNCLTYGGPAIAADVLAAAPSGWENSPGFQAIVYEGLADKAPYLEMVWFDALQRTGAKGPHAITAAAEMLIGRQTQLWWWQQRPLRWLTERYIHREKAVTALNQELGPQLPKPLQVMDLYDMPLLAAHATSRMIAILATHRIRLPAIDDTGKTLLHHLATRTDWSAEDIRRLHLICPTHTQDKAGNFPLHIALMQARPNHHLVPHWVAHCNTRTKNKAGHTCEQLMAEKHLDFLNFKGRFPGVRSGIWHFLRVAWYTPLQVQPTAESAQSLPPARGDSAPTSALPLCSALARYQSIVYPLDVPSDIFR